jgi:hypothetical protein
MSAVQIVRLVAVGVFLGVVCGCSPSRTVLIDTPNPCYELEKVEVDRVYLQTSKRICIQVMGRIPVDMDPSLSRVEVYTDGTFWREQTVTEASPDDLKQIRKQPLLLQ